MPDCEAETPFFGLVYGFLHYFFVIFLHNDSWFERQMSSSSLERSNPVYLHFEAPRYVICRAIMSSLMNVILYLFHFPLIKIKVVSLLDWIFVHEFCCRHAAFSFLFFLCFFSFALGSLQPVFSTSRSWLPTRSNFLTPRIWPGSRKSSRETPPTISVGRSFMAFITSKRLSPSLFFSRFVPSLLTVKNKNILPVGRSCGSLRPCHMEWVSEF